MRSFFLASLFSVLFAVLAKAQAPEAPVFDCIRGDTLFWAEPSDPCGSLISIEVFGSENAAGPFTFIDTVRAGIGPFFPLNAQQLSRFNYFYVRARYAAPCSPPLSAPSDTLNTIPLPVPRILSVDYDISGTRIVWENPSDPRVAAFWMYKTTFLGSALLDTIVGTIFFEPGTAVERSSSIYNLASVDGCGAATIDPVGYASAVVDVTRNACEANLTIRRRMATPWPRTLVRTVITRTRVDGFVDSIEINRADTVLTVDDLDSDTAYTVRVTYYDEIDGYTRAFPVDLGSQAFVAVDTIEIAQVSFEQGIWTLRWRWEPRAGYEDTEVLLRRGSAEILRLEVDPSLNTLPIPVVELDLAMDFDWDAAEILVRATDACGVMRQSAVARPGLIFARETGPFTVAVDYRLPLAPAADLGMVQIRLLDTLGGSQLLSTFSGDSVLQYTHDVTSVNSREVCYELVTEVLLPAILRRGASRFLWRSAPGCAQRTPRVYLPTGFVPEGYTIEYRPRMSLIDGLDYKLEIFDRWGKLLFETTDPFEGWTANEGNRFLPPGLYLAIVTLEEEGRDPYRVESSFTLVR